MSALLEQPVATARSRQEVSAPVVCHLVHSLNLGGAEVLATRIALRLAEQFPPVFACLDDAGALADRLAERGIPAIHLRRGRGIDLSCARRLKNWLREQEVAIIHAHQSTPFAYALLSSFVRRPPIVFTEHGRFYPDQPSWKRRLVHRALLRKSDRLVAVGNSVRQALVDVERLPQAQMEVVYNGIAPAPADPDGELRRGVRGALGVSEATFVIVHVARFDPIKNHSLALAAFREVLKTGVRAQLWLVGDGPTRADIEEEAVELGLGSAVRFLGPSREVPALLAAADAAILTSHSEGIPLVLIEAMAAGIPVAATAVGGVPEIITHEQNGLLAASGDAAALAAHLIALAKSPALRQSLSAAGRLRAEFFTEDRMVGDYERIYREVLAP